MIAEEKVQNPKRHRQHAGSVRPPERGLEEGHDLILNPLSGKRDIGKALSKGSATEAVSPWFT
jgi:hypothetical protein